MSRRIPLDLSVRLPDLLKLEHIQLTHIADVLEVETAVSNIMTSEHLAVT